MWALPFRGDEVFGEVGYHRTVEQILKRAKIARPTFYRYFASVAEAANTVLERTDEAILSAVIAAFGKGDDLTSKVVGAVDAYLAWAEGRGGALHKATYAGLHDPTSPVSTHRVSVQTVLANAILEQFRLMKRKPPTPLDIDLALNTVLYAGFMLNTSHGDGTNTTHPVTFTVHRNAPAPLTKPDGAKMRVPKTFTWHAVDTDGTTLLAINGVTNDDFVYRLAPGHVGSYEYTGTDRGRVANGDRLHRVDRPMQGKQQLMARSWWGWGTDEAALSLAETDQLVGRVRALLPDHDFTDHAPPAVSTLAVPAPTIAAPASLHALCSTDPVDRLGHARGKAFRDVVRNLHGDIGPLPQLVVRPRAEQDIVDVLDWCSRESIAVIPYGGGSSVVGGVEPRFERPAISLDLANLSAVLEIDATSRCARIQGGALGPHLEAQLREHDLTLRHFPQSFEFSTLGGWLATRAGGHFATLYTHIDELTESMRVVTPQGISESRRLPGSGAGPSPDRLFLGSEGTLGIITEAWMRLQNRPRWRASASVGFDSFSEAVAATRSIAQAGLFPSNCRLLDPAEAFLNAGTATSGGLLVLAFESADHPVDAWLQIALEHARAHGGVPREAEQQATSDDAAARWRESFLRMPYQRDALARRSMIVETFETACTWDRFENLHAAITRAAQGALAQVGATGVLTCRFTHVYPDGPAPYYGIYAAGRPGDTLAQWDDIKAAVSEALAGNGGTITHHHAVGRDHRPWYDRQRPDPFALALDAAKSALDPAGILNPGVLIR